MGVTEKGSRICPTCGKNYAAHLMPCPATTAAPEPLQTVVVLTMHEVYEEGHVLPMLVTSSLADVLPDLQSTDRIVTRKWAQVPE